MGIIKSLFSGGPKRADTRPAARAAESATALQEKIYEETKAREQPLYDIGLAGTQDLASRLGIAGDPAAEGYGGLTETFGADQFEADPGYQFRLDEGNQALERRLAAQGKTFSPEAAKALQGYGQNLASQEYGNAFDRYNVGQSNIYNRIAGLSGAGQQAGAQLTSAGQNYAGNVGQTAASLASTNIAADQAYQGRKQSMFNTLLGGGATLGGAYLGRG